MFLVDSNVWLALLVEPHVHHRAATEWFESLSTPGTAAFCRASQESLLRLITRAAVLGAYDLKPLSNRQAWAAFDTLLTDDRVVFLATEPSNLPERWRAFSNRGTASPKLWADAYLAAFAMERGYRMVTTDAGFRQFAGLDLLLLGSG